jgi:hypothetical protein
MPPSHHHDDGFWLVLLLAAISAPAAIGTVRSLLAAAP